MKVCQTCGVPKPIDAFYREGRTKRKPDCRDCYQAKRKEWRVNGGERGRDAVGKETSEHFAANPGAKRRENELTKARNPDKRRARLVLAMRIYRGTLTRPTTCDRCHAECKPEAHHHDYSKPLDVEWLCKPCHVATHARLRKGEAA